MDIDTTDTADTRDRPAASPDPATPAEVPTLGLVSTLRFELLKHMSTIALLSAGGAITLLQTIFADHEAQFTALLGIGLLMTASLTAFTAQTYLVERLAERLPSEESEYLLPKVLPRTRKLERFLQNAALAQLGLGVGFFTGFALDAL